MICEQHGEFFESCGPNECPLCVDDQLIALHDWLVTEMRPKYNDRYLVVTHDDGHF